MIYPGFDGGAEWGGAAVDPHSGIMYVNAHEMPWILTMVEIDESMNTASGSASGGLLYARQCIGCHGPDRLGNHNQGIASLIGVKDRLSPEQILVVLNSGREMMPAFKHLNDTEKEKLIDYLSEEEAKPGLDGHASQVAIPSGESPYAHTGYNRFLDEEGYPAVKPPWGTLNAIDLNVGKILWTVPLGEFEVLTQRGIPQTGTENYGGPILTGCGLIFIGASKDEKFRAFDRGTGATLWETQLPTGGYATPSTYSVGGRQYVVIAAGGGKMGTKPGDTYVAFALPK